MDFKSGELTKAVNEHNEMLSKANVERVKQIILPLSDIEKKEAIKFFDDEMLLNEFISRFYSYKDFALNMFNSVNEMKLKVGVDK